jgi:hypothetical protein
MLNETFMLKEIKNEFFLVRVKLRFTNIMISCKITNIFFKSRMYYSNFIVNNSFSREWVGTWMLGGRDKSGEDNCRNNVIYCNNFSIKNNCNFVYNVFKKCLFEDKIYDCNFENSNFISCTFTNQFIKCNFTNCKFNNFSLENFTYFDYCDLTNSKFNSNRKQYNIINNTIQFYKSSMENIDMSNNDLSNFKLRLKKCNTKNAKFNGCVVKELESDFTFHVEFLLKGGIVENTKDNYVDKVLIWIGQKIN